MKIGPKYKIARRLGAPIFEKTQTPKYALSLARKERNSKGRGKPKSEYGRELIEKQKARFSYGLTEKQFRNYVDKSLHEQEPIQKLFTILESRLDNVLFRSGLSKTRAQARQTASHGHIMVNGRRASIASRRMKIGDVISVRPGSMNTKLFEGLSERLKTLTVPTWFKVDAGKLAATFQGKPKQGQAEMSFNLTSVVEFYSR